MRYTEPNRAKPPGEGRFVRGHELKLTPWAKLCWSQRHIFWPGMLNPGVAKIVLAQEHILDRHVEPGGGGSNPYLLKSILRVL
jgi:hypothetical protein